MLFLRFHCIAPFCFGPQHDLLSNAPPVKCPFGMLARYSIATSGPTRYSHDTNLLRLT